MLIDESLGNGTRSSTGTGRGAQPSLTPPTRHGAPAGIHGAQCHHKAYALARWRSGQQAQVT